jgi:hypothetical protein
MEHRDIVLNSCQIRRDGEKNQLQTYIKLVVGKLYYKARLVYLVYDSSIENTVGEGN